MASRPPPKNRFLAELVTSGLGVGIATGTTNPIDVVKVRLQLQALRAPDGTKTPGLVRTGVLLVQQEGVFALWSGLSAALTRALFYGGTRLGLYGPVKRALGADSAQPSMLLNLTAGCISGAVAAAVASPSELIKTRLQAKDNKHKGPVAVVKHVVATNGVRGLWKGTVPGMTRAAILTASQCATYDEVKQATMRLTGWSDSFGTHLASSMVTGLVSTTATAPVDVVKTHMFVGGSRYTGPVQCLKDILAREGVRGLFKGWSANYARLGPQTTITFVAVEKLRLHFGLDTM